MRLLELVGGQGQTGVLFLSPNPWCSLIQSSP